MRKLVDKPVPKPKGVVVTLRSGGVVRYRGATDFSTGRDGVYIKNTRRKQVGKGRGAYTQNVVKTLAYYPMSAVSRVELAGTGNPPPRADPKKKVSKKR